MRPIFVMMLGAASTVAAGACSADTAGIRRYEGVAVERTVAWAKGNVAVVNRNGSVRVDTAGRRSARGAGGRRVASGIVSPGSGLSHLARRARAMIGAPAGY